MSKNKPLTFLFTFIMTIAFVYHGQSVRYEAPPEKQAFDTNIPERIAQPGEKVEPPTILTGVTVHMEPDSTAEAPEVTKRIAAAPIPRPVKQPASRSRLDTPALAPSPPVPDRDKPFAGEPVDAPAEITPEPKPEPEPSPAPDVYDTDLNSYVLDIIPTYQGSYPYLLNNDYANYNGVTENLYFGGRLLAKAHSSGNRASHCSGITFEVFFKAMQARNRKLGLSIDDFNGMGFRELSDFLQMWYVASGNKLTNNIEIAVEKYGIGKRISNFAEARPGDFMDISRSNNTGHTVVFLNWVHDSNGKIIGVHYWSSQSSTNGIAEKTEYFDVSGRGNVYYHQVYIARILPVSQYKPFR